MIYLDNAATSFPKPESVYSECSRCMREYCGNPGRGSHFMARAASEKLFEIREKLATVFNAPSPENVVFTLNTTYALNIAIKSIVKKGDGILISDLEHNSVFRSVNAVCVEKGAKYDVFKTYFGSADGIIKELNEKIRPETKLVVCLHASNICGTVLPLEQIGLFCRKHGLYFIVDAAQSAGIFDIDIKRCGINALCLPAHKGFLGPQGIAAVIFNGDMENLSTIIEGGSGINSQSVEMPDFLPDRFEAGTMPTPAAAGFSAGIDFVLKNGFSAIRKHESALARAFLYDLISDKCFTVYSCAVSTGIVLFNMKGLPSVDVASKLNDDGICVRSGFHCAPLAHKTMKTGDSGAVRVSFGAFNTSSDISGIKESLYKIKKGIL